MRQTHTPARRLLDALAHALGLSQAGVLKTLIRAEAKRHGVNAESDESPN